MSFIEHAIVVLQPIKPILAWVAMVSLPTTVVLYYIESLDSFADHKFGFALAWACYATANIGLIMAMRNI